MTTDINPKDKKAKISGEVKTPPEILAFLIIYLKTH